MPGSAEAGKAFIRLVVKDETKIAMRNAMRRFRAMSMGLRATKKQFRLVALGAAMARKSISLLKIAVISATVALAAIAAAGVIFTAKSIKSAADMQETMNAFNETFRESADQVSRWAAVFSFALGRSRQETLDALTSFQAFMVGLGLGPKASKDMSKSLTRLSADFASFRNLTDAEAVQRFMSSLAGEPERLRRFGVNIGEAAVNLKLMAMGFPRVQQGATELQKVLARYQIILETLGRQNALGDAIRTAGSFVNQMKRMRGSIDELKFALGNALLPAMTEVIRVTNIWLDGFIEKSAAWGNFSEPLARSVGEWMAILQAGATNWEMLFESVAVKIKLIFAQLFLELSQRFLKMIEGIKGGVDAAVAWAKGGDTMQGKSFSKTIVGLMGMIPGSNVNLLGAEGWNSLMAKGGTLAAEAWYAGTTPIGDPYSPYGGGMWDRSMAAGQGFANQWNEDSTFPTYHDWASRIGTSIGTSITGLEDRQRELSRLWAMEVQRIKEEHRLHAENLARRQQEVQEEEYFDPASVTSDLVDTTSTQKRLTMGSGTATLSSAVGLLGRDLHGEIREQTKQLRKANGHLSTIAQAGGPGLGQ